jgi:hypothetical protein
VRIRALVIRALVMQIRVICGDITISLLQSPLDTTVWHGVGMPSLPLPRQLARTRRFRLRVSDRFTISADGGTVLFLRSRAGDDPVTCLWALDVRDGRERLLADPDGLTGGAAEGLPEAERTWRERAREEGSGIVSYAADRPPSSHCRAKCGRRIGLDGARTQVQWDIEAFEYVPAAGWDDHGPFAAVQSRDRRTVLVLGIDPADGTTRVLAE